MAKQTMVHGYTEHDCVVNHDEFKELILRNLGRLIITDAVKQKLEDNIHT